MSDDEHGPAIARLEAKMDMMIRTVDRLEKLNEGQSKQMASIELQLSAAQGGLRVVKWIGGLATAAVGGVVVWAAKHLHWQ